MSKENSITVNLIHVKDTSNYVVYENMDMDFRTPGTKCRLWIPKSEIETNVPGMFPPGVQVVIEGEQEKQRGQEEY